MKKIFIILFTVFLNIAFFSCNPERIADDLAPQACCGEEGNILPPPPPPPPPASGDGG
jgi:hypothetical protein